MKIKSIKIVKLKTKEEVYDLTVPKYHNFFVEAGCYVHNCCQVIYKIFSNPIQTNIMDLANSIKNTRENITSQVKPMYYNTPKKAMSQREAVKLAMSMFNKK